MIDPISLSGEYLIDASAANVTDAIESLLGQEDKLSEIATRAANDDALSANDGYWPENGHWMAQYRPYVVRDGVLTIPVRGMLLNHFSITYGNWATGYDYIRRALQRGLEDTGVTSIALDVNSPGGLVSGCFDLADEIYAARSKKPIIAACNEHAYSAAYALASAAGRITLPRTGGVGSIGVVGTHYDVSEMLTSMGVKVTFIQAGARKTDGAAEKPLDEGARSRWQARINATYEIFVSTVARNRGLDAAGIRATEADVFGAEEAVANGLADLIGTASDSIAAFAAELSETERDDTMSDKDEATVTQAVHDQAVASAKADGMAEGATAERERISAIMGSEEAASRPKAAKQVAFSSDWSVEQATSFLAGLDEEAAAKPAAPAEPEATPAAGASAFAKAMNTSDNPDLGAGEEEAKGGDNRLDQLFRDAGVAK